MHDLDRMPRHERMVVLLNDSIALERGWAKTCLGGDGYDAGGTTLCYIAMYAESDELVFMYAATGTGVTEASFALALSTFELPPAALESMRKEHQRLVVAGAFPVTDALSETEFETVAVRNAQTAVAATGLPVAFATLSYSSAGPRRHLDFRAARPAPPLLLWNVFRRSLAQGLIGL